MANENTQILFRTNMFFCKTKENTQIAAFLSVIKIKVSATVWLRKQPLEIILKIWNS